MRNFNPWVLASLIAASAIPALAQNSKPDSDLLAGYENAAKNAEKTSPVVARLFGYLHRCVPAVGKKQVAQAENQAEAERMEQFKNMNESRETLKGADAAIKKEMNAQLQQNLKIDTSKVDVCQGDSDTFKNILNEAKSKAKAAANARIDSIAGNLKERQKKALASIRAQMAKNSREKETDAEGLGRAKAMQNLPVIGNPSALPACDGAIQMVESEATNNELKPYVKFLVELDQKVSTWKDQKKAAVAAELDAQVDQQIAPKLVDRNKCGNALAQNDPKSSSKAPDSDVSKPKDEPKVAKSDKAASVTGTPAAKADSVAADAPKTQESSGHAATQESLTAKTGKSNADDVAGQILKDTAPASGDAAAQPDNGALAELSKHYEEATRPFGKQPEATAENDGAVAPGGLKPLTAEDVNVAKTGTYQSNSDVELKPTEAMPPVQALDDAPQRGLASNFNSPKDSNLSDLKTSYQNDSVFKNRDLDFNSSKDTKYIQKALNEVMKDPWGKPTIAVDGVFGSRTTLALDQVMQNPEKKAEFLKALRVQMAKR